MLIPLFIITIILMFLGIPIAYSLGFAALVSIVVGGFPLGVLIQRMFIGINSFILLALPLFVLAGGLMNETGIAEQLVNFSKVLVGKVRGSLAIVNIVTSIFFAGISGSATADTSALGTILIPAMEKEGYDTDFSAAVTAASSVIGPIIPPSIIMVILGVATDLSIGGLFVAGFFPGILLGLLSIIIAIIISRQKDYGKRVKNSIPIKKKLKIVSNSIPALVMPFIILGGLLSGFFTPTEAAGIAVLYASLYGLFTKRLSFAKIKKVLINTIDVVGTILIIISTASAVGWILATNQVPDIISQWFLQNIGSTTVFLILIDIFLIIVGMFFDGAAAIVIFAPTLILVAETMGISKLHFGFIIGFNLTLGMSTPPLGLCLYVASSIAKISVLKISKAILPFYIAYIIALVIVTFVPAFILFLPKLFGFSY